MSHLYLCTSGVRVIQKMAANEMACNSWRTPFSTPIRKDDSACRDLFHNSEKLLASAVSICRLKGSVECQTGGLITVCEELQSLIRLAFAEINRLEKDLKSQRGQFDDEISCLKDRMRCLEERESQVHDNTENENVVKQVQKTNIEKQCSQLNEASEVEDKGSSRLPLVDENSKDFHPFRASSDSSSFPLGFKSPVQQVASKKIPLLDSKMRLKRKPLKKLAKLADSANNTPASTHGCSFDASSCVGLEKDSLQLSEDPEAEDPSNVLDLSEEGNMSQIQNGNTKLQLPLKESSEISCDAKQFKGITRPEDTSEKGKDSLTSENPRKKTKVRNKLVNERSIRVCSSNYSVKKSEYEENEEEPGRKRKGRKTKPNGSSSQEASNHLDSVQQDQDPKSEAISNGSFASNRKSQTGKVRDAATEKGLTEDFGLKEKDQEPLGNLSFLININSQIYAFVSDPDQEECELQPMTGRERNDVYKLTHLYKVRARIGRKTVNSLTTVHLSKQPDTQLPKPGRIDHLLSELSITASREAEKETSKGKAKRKTPPSMENLQCGNNLEGDVPPKKKTPRLSKTKKE